MGIVKGSIAITMYASDINYYFFKEVPYLDGATEFSSQGSEGGKYSVDYRNGILYADRALSAIGGFDISYRYSNYTASYRIAREVDSKHYEVDTASQQISIKDGEFFRHLETPKTTQAGRAPFYLINYDYVSETRDDIQNLKDHFTPVVKDYVLKILKKGVLF
jgi:hypothetical protein